jgi:hypothetical protein
MKRALASIVVGMAAICGCTSGDGPSAPGTVPDAGTSGGTTCQDDPLRTGLVAPQTGVSADAFDCEIVTSAAKHAEPDPMIFKAIIYVESRFDTNATACPNHPCGQPPGWTDAETGCYGLMQVVAACEGFAKAAFLPTGHPNLAKSATSSEWATSLFNPGINIDIGIAGIADNRAQVMRQFSGCTTDQYTLMAIGNYGKYGSTKSCTEINQDYMKPLLEAYTTYAKAAGYTAHPYLP